MREVVFEVEVVVHHGIKDRGYPDKADEKAWVLDLQRSWVEDWLILVGDPPSHQGMDVVM